jgi:hypothetical protein
MNEVFSAPANNWARIQGRPHQRSAAGLWLGQASVAVAWLGLLLAFASPPHGSGLSVCWSQNSIGVPCLGCGLTRSLSCAVRGMFLESWHYHPMGLLILALFAITAMQSLSPGPLRVRLAGFVEAHAAFFNTLYVAFVAAFIAFGATRALFHCTSWLPHLARSF